MAPGETPPADIPSLIGIERARLLELLAGLDDGDWHQPTPCPEWDVLALGCHLVGVDLSSLSRHRDHYLGTPAPGGLSEAGFIEWIDELQMEWVRAARRLSPPVVVDLLAWAAPQLVAMLEEEDPSALTAHVSWAGPDPLPAWLDQRRELSEYWIHRQQLLEALGRPADLRPELAGPVLDGLRWAYPFRLQDVGAEAGDTVVVAITGPDPVTWNLVAGGSRWEFRSEPGARVVACLSMTTDQAWRLLTNNLVAKEVDRLETSGNPRILEVILATRAIIGSPQ
ncbi:MAG TPA: maleylpyruvate isomerase family mycothiol-dependent enzyme [Acidimicrobiales bacterium]|jgi:uncharacterized protein (TIGR03083 family)|nr:maleylpyruvate isomerase family mycothiol-dependent enzyme [Acidimicrobiales bacterium]